MVEFVRPWWLVLLGFVPLVVLMSRRSLSGLGPVRKWLAITARAAGVACLAMALAEPRLRRESETVTVLFVVDRSFSKTRTRVPPTRRPPGTCGGSGCSTSWRRRCGGGGRTTSTTRPG